MFVGQSPFHKAKQNDVIIVKTSEVDIATMVYHVKLYTIVSTLLIRQRPTDSVQSGGPTITHVRIYVSVSVDFGDKWLLPASSAMYHRPKAQKITNQLRLRKSGHQVILLSGSILYFQACPTSVRGSNTTNLSSVL